MKRFKNIIRIKNEKGYDMQITEERSEHITNILDIFVGKNIRKEKDCIWKSIKVDTHYLKLDRDYLGYNTTGLFGIFGNNNESLFLELRYNCHGLQPGRQGYYYPSCNISIRINVSELLHVLLMTIARLYPLTHKNDPDFCSVRDAFLGGYSIDSDNTRYGDQDYYMNLVKQACLLIDKDMLLKHIDKGDGIKYVSPGIFIKENE